MDWYVFIEFGDVFLVDFDWLICNYVGDFMCEYGCFRYYELNKVYLNNIVGVYIDLVDEFNLINLNLRFIVFFNFRRGIFSEKEFLRVFCKFILDFYLGSVE